jgi:hypothetical protein
LDDKNSYVGYYEIDDIMSFSPDSILERTRKNNKGKKGVLDYSMSQITQIVESNNGKLLGLFISESDVNSIEVTMKISLGAINEIIQSFRRYNEIISEHQEDNYINSLKERSDYLDKYLICNRLFFYYFKLYFK